MVEEKVAKSSCIKIGENYKKNYHTEREKRFTHRLDIFDEFFKLEYTTFRLLIQ